MHFDTDKKWVDGEYTEMEQHVTLHSLASAKKLMKQNRDKYVSSCITQTWSNGEWENLGELGRNQAQRLKQNICSQHKTKGSKLLIYKISTQWKQQRQFRK